jgi:hypothetical protein
MQTIEVVREIDAIGDALVHLRKASECLSKGAEIEARDTLRLFIRHLVNRQNELENKLKQ